MCIDCISSYTKSFATEHWSKGNRWIQREMEGHDLHPALLNAIHEAGLALSPRGHDNSEYMEFIKKIAKIIAPEWPHPSLTDASQVAYTRSPEHGAADRQTYCKLGSYINKHLPMLAGDRIETIVTLYKQHSALKFRIVTDGDLVAAMFKTTAHSCMHPCKHNSIGWTPKNHPYLAYSSRTGWGMAIREDESGMGHARSIVRLNEKQYIRIYGSYPDGSCSTRGDDPALRAWLAKNGYTPVQTFAGYHLERIKDEHHPGYHIGPYIDGNCKTAKMPKTFPQDIIVHPDGNLSMNRTDGRLAILFEDHEGMVRCANNEWILPEDARRCTDGRIFHYSRVVKVERIHGLWPISETQEINGKPERKCDLASYYDYNLNRQFAIRDETPLTQIKHRTHTICTRTADLVMTWNGHLVFPQDCIRLATGKYAGQWALWTDTVTRKKDDIVVLKAFMSTTPYYLQDAQWIPAIGDRVKLTQYAHEQYGTDTFNPVNTEGTIIRVNGEYYTVRWYNHDSNSYCLKQCFTLVMSASEYAKLPKPEPVPMAGTINHPPIYKQTPNGTRVELSPSSPYQDQSEGGPGTITRTDAAAPFGHCWQVQWDNGQLNVYRTSDLLVIEPDVIPAEAVSTLEDE